MDIINELKNIEEKSMPNFNAVYYNKIAPASKERNYLEKSTGWVFACCNVISDEIAKTKLKLYKRKGDNVEEVVEHPILDLLYRANNFTTKYDLFWLIGQYLELAGEAPLFVERENGIPKQIYLLRPDKITVKAGQEGEFVSGYVYRNDKGTDIPIEVDEMVFIKYPDPVNSFRGQGTLQGAAIVADIEEYSEEYNKNYFYNSATPSMFFKTEQKLTKDVRENFRKSLNQNFKGVHNAHKFLILEGGLDAKPLQLSQKDMDFINQLNWTRDKILGIFRVPRTALGITDDVNRANAEATDYVFAKRTIKPKITRIIEQLNEFLVPMFGDGESLFLDFEDPVPEDKESKIKYYESGLNKGYLTINEVRVMEGLEVLDNADVPLLPMNLQPIGTSLNPVEIGKSIDRRNKKATKEFAKSEKNKAIDEVIKDSVKEVKGDIKNLVHSEEARRTKISKKWIESKKEKAWKNLIQRTDKDEDRIIKACNKQFNRQIDEIMKGKKKKGYVLPNKWLLDVDKERNIWFKVFLPIITDIVAREGQDALNSVATGMKFDVLHRAKTFIEDKTMKFSWEVNKTTNEKIKRVLKANINENEVKIGRELRKEFADMKVNRSKLIARTETFKATNFATEEGYIQSDVVEGKEWFTALDERVCEFCAEMEGKTMGLGKAWKPRGSSMTGQEGGTLKFDYETIIDPPLHANCRCRIVPILK